MAIRVKNMLAKCSKKKDNLCSGFVIILFSPSATGAQGNGNVQHKKTLARSCVGCDNEAVKINGRSGNFTGSVGQ